MSTKKVITILGLIVILAMVLSACGGQQAPAPAATAAPAPDGHGRAGSRRERLEDDLRDRAAGGESVLWRDAGDRRQEG